MVILQVSKFGINLGSGIITHSKALLLLSYWNLTLRRVLPGVVQQVQHLPINLQDSLAVFLPLQIIMEELLLPLPDTGLGPSSLLLGLVHRH